MRDEAFGYVLHPVDLATHKVGLLLLQGSRIVQPDPDRLQDYATHAGQRRGHWPGSVEIISAMFERAAYEEPHSDAAR